MSTAAVAEHASNATAISHNPIHVNPFCLLRYKRTVPAAAATLKIGSTGNINRTCKYLNWTKRPHVELLVTWALLYACLECIQVLHVVFATQVRDLGNAECNLSELYMTVIGADQSYAIKTLAEGCTSLWGSREYATMYISTQAVVLRTLCSKITPSRASGNVPSKALGRADVKYQCNGIVPHSELLQENGCIFSNSQLYAKKDIISTMSWCT